MQIIVGILQIRHLDAVILLGFVSETELLILLLGVATYVINLFITEQLDLFRQKQCLTVLKIMQISADVVNIGSQT